MSPSLSQHLGVISRYPLSVEGCNDKLADPMPINRLDCHLGRNWGCQDGITPGMVIAKSGLLVA
jgi:hypothetical protein